MSDDRKSMTTEYLLEKQKNIATKLESDEHGTTLEPMYYGNADCFNIKLARCDTCQGDARTVAMDDRGKIRWFTYCMGCNKATMNNRKQSWLSIFDWASMNLNSLDYKDLPFFKLKNLNHEDAKIEMTDIKNKIELKRKSLGIKNKFEPSRCLEKQLAVATAMVLWACLAMKLIRNAARNINRRKDEPAIKQG